jgi:hypothetical protein
VKGFVIRNKRPYSIIRISTSEEQLNSGTCSVRVLQVFFFVAAIVLVATVSAGPMPGPIPLPAKDLKGSEAVYYASYGAYPYAAVPAYAGYVYAG